MYQLFKSRLLLGRDAGSVLNVCPALREKNNNKKICTKQRTKDQEDGLNSNPGLSFFPSSFASNS